MAGEISAASQPMPIACSATPMATIRRPPMRSESRPAMGAVTAGAGGQGGARAAGSRGGGAVTDGGDWGNREMSAEMPMLVNSMVVLVAENPRLRNSDGGIIGWAARDSQAPNAAIRSPPATRLPSTWGLVQPWLLPRTSPNTMPNNPAVARMTPAGSRRPDPERLSRVSSSSGSTAMPLGTLIQKIHCQDAASVTAPPTTRPTAAP